MAANPPAALLRVLFKRSQKSNFLRGKLRRFVPDYEKLAQSLADGHIRPSGDAEHVMRDLGLKPRRTSIPGWSKLRYQVLRRDGAICALCGASPADGIRMEVDHIK